LKPQELVLDTLAQLPVARVTLDVDGTVAWAFRWLSWTRGRRVSWVKLRSQLPTVRAVGTRARPQKRRTTGSPAR
jgi:hypothetical protein